MYLLSGARLELAYVNVGVLNLEQHAIYDRNFQFLFVFLSNCICGLSSRISEAEAEAAGGLYYRGTGKLDQIFAGGNQLIGISIAGDNSCGTRHCK